MGKRQMLAIPGLVRHSGRGLSRAAVRIVESIFASVKTEVGLAVACIAFRLVALHSRGIDIGGSFDSDRPGPGRLPRTITVVRMVTL
jgi:hypothetical protein